MNLLEKKTRRAKFRDTHRAFSAFDGPDGNGVLGLREFEEGMRWQPGSWRKVPWMGRVSWLSMGRIKTCTDDVFWCWWCCSLGRFLANAFLLAVFRHVEDSCIIPSKRCLLLRTSVGSQAPSKRSCYLWCMNYVSEALFRRAFLPTSDEQSRLQEGNYCLQGYFAAAAAATALKRFDCQKG